MILAFWRLSFFSKIHNRLSFPFSLFSAEFIFDVEFRAGEFIGRKSTNINELTGSLADES